MTVLNTIPNILEQTRNGLQAHSIADEMFRRREIACMEEINYATVNSIIMQILELETEDPNGEIIFFINSPGGEVTSGLALYDVMQAVSCPFRTVCLGEAASMAAVLFVAGDVREMLPHSYIMIHDPLTRGISGSALSVRTECEELMRMRNTTCGLLAEHCKKTIEEIYEKTKQDSYFYADEAVKFGLADRVIDSLSFFKDHENA